MLIHVVSSGDSLWSIANSYRVSMDDITRLNELQSQQYLVVGQSLVIPTAATSHIVNSGENLWAIAMQYGISLQSLLQANPSVDPNLIYPGTRLIIPPMLHTVQAGETVMSIANRYRTTVSAIVEANQLQDPNMINVGMSLVIPRMKPTIEVNAYSYQSNEDAVNTLNEIGSLLTYFSPFAYMIKEDGSLEPFDDSEMVAAAISKNIIPMLSITNFTSTEAGSNLAHVVLSNPQLQEALINNVLQVMDEKGYKALNVDFENVLPEDRENYNQFMQLAVDRLHPRGYLVSSALAPKASEEQGGLLYEAHDYEAHGRIADFVVLMTYEWGYRKGPPQAISPINQIDNVISYALTVMPADKIFLGFQIYARDWLLPHVEGQEAETFSPQEAVLRAEKYGATIQYDTRTQSPYYNYVDEQGRLHEVWFEDARSAQAKFDLTKRYHLRGVSYWALGYRFPQNWALLNDNFTIKRL